MASGDLGRQISAAADDRSEAQMEFNLVYHKDEAEASQAAGRGFDASLIRAEIEKIVATAAAGDEFLTEHSPRLTWVKDLPPFETPGDSPLLAAVSRAWEQVAGAPPDIQTMNGWSDAAFVPVLAGCEVVNLG